MKNEEIALNHYMSLIKGIIYIDDPFVLDDLNLRKPFRFINTHEHSMDLLNKISGKDNDAEFSVLDEPEIHLHPEWQLKFAEIIVLIQRESGTNILLNTHSPYFLNAIEVYSQKHGISEVCNFYLTEAVNMRVNILDVTGKTEFKLSGIQLNHS